MMCDFLLEAGWKLPITLITYPQGAENGHWELDFYVDDPNAEEIYQVIEAIMLGYTTH
jgi:hypothetical protein